MIFEEFKKEIFKCAKINNVEFFELYIEKAEDKSISCFKHEINDYSTSVNENINFRCLIDGKIGSCSINGIDLDKIPFIVETSINNAKFMQENKFLSFIEDCENLFFYDTEPLASFEELKNAVLNMEKQTLSLNHLITSVPICKISQSNIIINIVNNFDMNITRTIQNSIALIQCVATKENKNYTFFDFEQSKYFKNLDFSELSKKVVQKTINQIDAKKIQSKTYKAILKNDVFIDILQSFSPIFSAENAFNKLSLLGNKENQIIASKNISIIDTNISIDKSYYYPFDDNGEKTFEKYIIKDGELKTLLYNNEWAKRLNKKSTSSGFKDSFASNIGISPCVLYIKSGNKNIEELIDIIEDGVFITQVSGLHSGINFVTGEASLDSKGFLIENKNIAYPIENFTISFNIYELLNNVIDVANDLTFSIAYKNSQYGSPSLAVKDIHIAGV